MPDILLIDSYDSFTFNLADLVRQSIPSSTVHVIHNDSLSSSQLVSLLPHFDAVVVGPGPGSPDDPKAVGVIPTLWALEEAQTLPVLGVCLGHQSLCLAFGGKLQRLKDVKHGLKSVLLHNGTDIFEGVEVADVVRYHSLHVELPSPSSEMLPLASAKDQRLDGSSAEILMAARHRSKPFWGVQYHPESICTSGGGKDVVQNFWTLASAWNEAHGRTDLVGLQSTWRHCLTPESRALHPAPLVPKASTSSETPWAVKYVSTPLADGRSSVPRICETLRGADALDIKGDFVVLDSSASTGRFTIIGLISSSTPRIEYVVGDTHVTIRRGEERTSHPLDENDVWGWIARYMDEKKCVGGATDCPFWGGLIGIANYEAGVASLDVPILARSSTDARGESRRPDLLFAFVERSVVLDLQENVAYVQSIALGEDATELEWLHRTSRFLGAITDAAFTPRPTPPLTPDLDKTTRSGDVRKRSKMKITMPAEEDYISKIHRAQDYLRAGESYEICLTALTRIDLLPPPPSSSSPSSEYLPWRLFKVLRALNPATYGTYISLGPLTLVGSSPERFVSWTREGKCQLRPIKGTIKKSRGPGKEDVSYEEAKEILLGSQKEIAENLMIVDLIRHDLHRVVSAPLSTGGCRTNAEEGVKVAKLFAVEETETVWHLVSVIEGTVDTEDGYTGWDVLSRSLPPGSMTGAPKKRSVELLQELESTSTQDSPSESAIPTERGIYSGVCGYWCVGGGGDFSVIIRSAFRYGDPSPSSSASNDNVDGAGETWFIGAGGAITALSDPKEEWEEMRIKLEGALRAFAYV